MTKTIIMSIFIILVGVSAFGQENKGKEYLQDTIKRFREECKDKRGIEYLNCWSENSPEKCNSLVYGKDRSAWTRCVYSCGSAGFVSRTFGECSY